VKQTDTENTGKVLTTRASWIVIAAGGGTRTASGIQVGHLIVSTIVVVIDVVVCIVLSRPTWRRTNPIDTTG
jgi:hypothetical protein